MNNMIHKPQWLIISENNEVSMLRGGFGVWKGDWKNNIIQMSLMWIRKFWTKKETPKRSVMNNLWINSLFWYFRARIFRRELCLLLFSWHVIVIHDISLYILHFNIDSVLAPTLYTISTMHCMSVSLAFNGEGLGTMWGKELAVNKLTEAGFKDIKIKNVEGDIMNYYYVSRK